MSSSLTEVEVVMPQMGVSVAEGTIVLWHKQPGDWVQADETICEITTDKIDSEVPSPASGRLLEILVEPEQTVPVGTPLARIATDAAAGEAHPAEHIAADGAAGEAHPAEHLVPDAAAGEAHPAEHLVPDAAAGDPPSADPVAAEDPAGEPHPAEPAEAAAHRGAEDGPPPAARHYSPVVQRIAEREGVDLARVTGSGRGGRVRKQDVLAFVHAHAREGNGNGNGSGNGSGGAPESPMHIESPYREETPTAEPAAALAGAATGHAAGAAPDLAPSPAPAGERLSRMRRSIAAHMVESLRTAAHCTSIIEADMSRIEAARRGSGLTYLPFVARCVVDALREHPDLNATLEGETLTRHDSVHLGIAVSLGSDGLIVPVVHDAQDLSHEGLAKRIADLARRARAGQLEADEVRGGTFTITNPGGFGTIASTPIINQPQVAILDLEAVVKRP